MNIIGTNIISSLGFTTEENFNAVKSGISGVKRYDAGTFDLPEAFMASLIDKEKLNDEFYRHCGLDSQSIETGDSDFRQNDGYTALEKAAILSVFTANKEAQIDLSNKNTIFILSTTKGNVELLDMRYAMCDNAMCDMRQENDMSQISNLKSQIYLWHTAQQIAGFFKNPNTPVVVSNACISGAAAQIAAMRELETGNYDYAVVAGVDFLSKFIISGFQSFKALSPELCQPFDKDRCGLNLGEAAATMIFAICDMRYATCDMRQEGDMSQISNLKSQIVLLNGTIRNDANHISAPSRTGEGSYRALQYILSQIPNPKSQIPNPKSQIAFINAHGTSTPYNDAAEVNAIVRAGLENVPVNSLKAFFGHTLGAAGILESIISIKALEENTVLKSQNFTEQDFENKINISRENHFSDKKYFIKMLSGFGGVNAALLFCRPRITPINTNYADETIRVNSCNLWIKKHINLSFKNSEEITEFYRSLEVYYPKFFKMDGLSKLGFVASEMIFKDEENRFALCEDMAIVCFNRSSSLDIDTQYQATIRSNENYFPSPSLFVYTLPNIVTGEIAIRNRVFCETSSYICKNFDAEQIFRTVSNVFSDKSINFVLAAWIECFENVFEVKMFLVTNEKTELEFLVSTLNIKSL